MYFYSLFNYLAKTFGHGYGRTTLSFDEIEKIIQRDLCPSYRSDLRFWKYSSSSVYQLQLRFNIDVIEVNPVASFVVFNIL